MSEWIKCSDRLPESVDPVLAHGWSRWSGYFHTFIGWTDGDSWYEINNGDYVDGGFGDDYEATVTHWQPLPAPPTE